MDFEEIYNSIYYDRSRSRKGDIAPQFCNTILSFYSNIDSVIDLGCGIGVFLNEFDKRGIDVRGVEASKIGIKENLLPTDKLECFDLRNDYNPDERYDLVLCIEVIEHIKEEYEDIVLDNITKCSDRVIFSAAVPGQPGKHHINCKPKMYWKDKMKERGYKFKAGKTLKIRKAMADENAMPYLIRNPMVFER